MVKIIKGLVVHVSDGDTLILQVSGSGKDEKNNKNKKRIRLAGIDTPESDQPGGQEAGNFLKDAALMKQARIRVVDEDKYGRIVGKVYVGRRCLNKALLAEGLAWHYKAYDNSAEYAGLEEAARSKKKGVFRQKNPTPPWDWRKAKKMKG